MSLVKAIQNRRQAILRRRELQRAFGSAFTPGQQSDIIFVSQRDR